MMWILRACLAALLVTTACALPPIAPLPPVTPPLHTLVFHVYNRAGAPVEGIAGVLRPDLYPAIACIVEEAGVVICPLTIQTGGAYVDLGAPGYKPATYRLILPLTDTTFEDSVLDAAVEPLQRLSVSGRRMQREDGTTFAWQGITAFQLADDVADGREAKAIALMDWAAANNVTILRVLVMANGLFQLNPMDGRAALPRVLELAAQRGLYVEVVALADTKSYQFDHRMHLSQIGHICTLNSACAAVEIANEPRHATQDNIVGNPTYLASLRALIPANIPVAYGASHGPSDESLDFAGGDYVTVHASRAGGDDGWRWVRHAREIQAQRDNHHGKFVVNDEPDRKAPFTDQHLALGLLMRIYGVGDTVHLASLRFDDIPTGAELQAFNARKQAWALVPDDMSGGRYTAGHLADSPVKVTESEVLRAYSSLIGNSGYTVMIKVTGSAATRWRQPHKLLFELGLTQFYSVNR